MKSSTVILSTLLMITGNSFAAKNSAEVMCRAQAKDIAMQTYSTCITDARHKQVDEIRKNYQKELSELKTKYDKQLNKITGGKTDKSKAAKAAITTDMPVKTVAPVVNQNITEDAQSTPIESQVEAEQAENIEMSAE